MSVVDSSYDAVIVGSGPNGLAAAIRLAEAGASVLVLEAKDRPGGGMRTGEITLPGFRHDLCSAAHPMGILSPYLATLPLDRHGLRWVTPKASVAHPLDDRPAVLLYESLAATAEQLGVDARAYTRLIEPFLHAPHELLKDALAPLGIPDHPFLMLRFGLRAIRSATGLAGQWFRDDAAKALFAGCAAHSILPLERPLTAALGLMFALTGHVTPWPVAEGGSESIARALVGYLESLGGRVVSESPVRSVGDLPPAKVYLFDTSPKQLAEIAGDVLPDRYTRRLSKYRYGPGAFKLDWALDGPIPWSDPRCLEASTVHLGGTIEEIAAAEAAVWRGEHPDRPYVLLCQQSQFDPSRAPSGKHTGYAYCHVPSGSTEDLTDVIEDQVERFAPGFKDIVLARHTMNTAFFEGHNANYVGGAITGGVADLGQLFTRPVARLDPYSTPNPKVFICSASTPPGGGVHGMCGFHAASSALSRLPKLAAGTL